MSESEPRENLTSNVKNELTWHRTFHTRDEARAAVFEYIEVFYNRQRLCIRRSTMSARCGMKREVLFLNQLSVEVGLPQIYYPHTPGSE